jgi:flagellar secretion chaperone FliS
MNDNNTANAYLRTKVMTAPPEELRLMLLDGAIKFAMQARTGIEQSDHEMIYMGFSQSRDIVLELLNSIKTEPAPEIANAVRELYTYLYGELVRANTEKNLDLLNEMIEILEYERETWALTIQQLAVEREQGIAAQMEQAQARQPISFQA